MEREKFYLKWPRDASFRKAVLIFVYEEVDRIVVL